eukprot:1803-Prymnesium_polylepis.1
MEVEGLAEARVVVGMVEVVVAEARVAVGRVQAAGEEARGEVVTEAARVAAALGGRSRTTSR